MSQTYCKYCKESFEGLYVNCPKCWRNLIPTKWRKRR